MNLEISTREPTLRRLGSSEYTERPNQVPKAKEESPSTYCVLIPRPTLRERSPIFDAYRPARLGK